MSLGFFFRGGTAGDFLGSSVPRTPGRYPYMPYRSATRHAMGLLLRDGGHPRCTCKADGQCVRFTVRACPEYGILELDELEIVPLDEA
jgi:hypothetical protein